MAIGNFSCDTEDTGIELLERACSVARDLGAISVIGPMDGDTWHSYRFVVESDGTKPFFLEPSNPVHFVAAFDRAGFERIEEYASAIDTTLAPPRRRRRLPGIRLRNWNSDDVEGELANIFRISTGAFASNRFFTPIERQAFDRIYEPIVPLVDPELIILGENDAGDAIGFLFAYSDPLDDHSPPAVVVKTYATVVRGAGGLMLDRLYDVARSRGCPAIIHALFHVDNRSRWASEHRNGRVFRRYALWGRELIR
ncbi:MAG: hypothetical protein OEQ29_05075 [Alphaproteobacteria bacterium]|nr:hypothetical protein [Alphaproteobacteria bacterium]